jgi:hypothetical protein
VGRVNGVAYLESRSIRTLVAAVHVKYTLLVRKNAPCGACVRSLGSAHNSNNFNILRRAV